MDIGTVQAIQAFSSMSPQTMHEFMLPQQTIAGGQSLAGTGVFMFFLMLTIGVIWIIAAVTSERKSHKYRKVITDMYVAGSVRKLAKEDGISIEEEFKEFKKFDKKSKREQKMLDLDATIEENLIDIQEERNNNAIAKLSEEKSSDDVVVIKKK